MKRMPFENFESAEGFQSSAGCSGDSISPAILNFPAKYPKNLASVDRGYQFRDGLPFW